MANLKCSAANCVHNMSGACSANSISIIGNNAYSSLSTNCGSFAEKGLRNSISNLSNFNVPGQIMQTFGSGYMGMAPSIQCEAENCRYNQNRECTAANVEITGIGALTNSRTHCETFIK